MEPQSVNIEQVTAEYQKIIGQLAHDLALTRAALAACQEELDIRPQLPWPPAGGGGAVVDLEHPDHKAPPTTREGNQNDNH